MSIAPAGESIATEAAIKILTKERPWLDGEPYYCIRCGVGRAEYYACESVECELESNEKACLRREAALATLASALSEEGKT